MYIFITAIEWGRSRLRTFGAASETDGAEQAFILESDIYPWSWDV
jgi:hypothetical protein